MMARAFENVNIYVLHFKTRHLKPLATRHQLQGSIVYIWTIPGVYLYLFYLLGLRQFTGGSSDPEYTLLHFHLQ